MRILLSVFLLALLATARVSADRPAAGSVADFPYQRIAAISREIDRRVDAHLASLNLNPNPLTDDETFLRRIHLEIAGRIPWLDRTRSVSNKHCQYWCVSSVNSASCSQRL